MICMNCLEADYQTVKTDLSLTVNGQGRVLRDLDCETCPACGDVAFTPGQNLEIDRKCIALEFGAKPLLTPAELKALRAVLGMNLNEICDLLHIGHNTYGRWERGEVEIAPAMNLLVHTLIEKIPFASVNVFEKERVAAIEKANISLVKNDPSFGEYLQKMIALTRLMPDIVSVSLGITPAELARIENNELAAEKIPHEITAKIAHYFKLPFETLMSQLSEASKIAAARDSGTAVYDISCRFNGRKVAKRPSRVSRVNHIPVQGKGAPQNYPQLSAAYLAKMRTALKKEGSDAAAPGWTTQPV